MTDTQPPLPQNGYIAVLTANGYVCRNTLSWSERDCAMCFLGESLDGFTRDQYLANVDDEGGKIIKVRLEARE